MSNNGSAASPWASLNSIFTANKTFAAGDTIFLRTGNHGYVTVKGVNADFVVITPERGQNPIISRMAISSFSTAALASFWKLYKLTIQSESSGASLKGDYALVEFFPNANNITLSSCTITSNPITNNWTRNDWRTRCNWGISTRARLNANYIIEKNTIKNVSIGISISSSKTIVRENILQNFTNDASRVLGSDILFEKNRITDLIKVMTVAENHDDLFQAFTYAAGGTGQDTLKNDIVRGNIFISTTDTNRPFVGMVQGIGCFDGVFLNWTVENNIVITDNYHGISFYDAVNCKIVNNTVLDPYVVTPIDTYDNNKSSIGPAWILIDTKGLLGGSSGNIVKNNLVSSVITLSSPTDGIASNNISIGAISNYSKYFVDISNLAVPASFDLHLKAGSLAISAGSIVDAPLVDFDDMPRPQGGKVDIGAYEFINTTDVSNKNSKNNEMDVYPNPFQNELNIVASSKLTDGAKIMLCDFNGQALFEQKINTNSFMIKNLSNLSSGLYFLIITDNHGNFNSTKISKLN